MVVGKSVSVAGGRCVLGDGRGRVRSAGGDQCPHTGGHRGLNTKW